MVDSGKVLRSAGCVIYGLGLRMRVLQVVALFRENRTNEQSGDDSKDEAEKAIG